MAPAALKEKIRGWLELEFSAEEIAGLLRTSIAEAESLIAEVTAPTKAQKRQRQELEAEQERVIRVERAREQARLRPMPPETLFEDKGPPFLPAPDVRDWLYSTFIDPSGELANELHTHLKLANIGVLWTPLQNLRKGRQVLGQAEKPFPRGDRWTKARAIWQLEQWFGVVPDFVLTFDANYALECDDWQWCALCEHELLHCAQRTDDEGCPMIDETGMPLFTLAAHDVEQFVNVAERYGAEAAGVDELVEAALNGPTIAHAALIGACGTCSRR